MNYSSKEEKLVQKKFLEKGYFIFNIIDKKNLIRIKKTIVKLSEEWFKKKYKKKNNFSNLNYTHTKIPVKYLNSYRLFIYEKINSYKWFSEAYFSLGKKYIEMLCGNELVMQKKCNLSIQFPNDDSSVLPLHSDVWVGDSEYEIVLWLPLVDCYSSKSMFILPNKQNEKHSKNFFKYKSTTNLFNLVKPDLKWLKINFGQGLLFTQNIMHGNIANKEKSTRWSFNCRFKSIFSPYRDKSIGIFFKPITMKPVTKLGMDYKYPNEK